MHHAPLIIEGHTTATLAATHDYCADNDSSQPSHHHSQLVLNNSMDLLKQSLLSIPPHEWQLLLSNNKMPMKTTTMEGREGGEASASQRTDWSVGTKMKDHVAMWDKIKRQWEEGELDLKVWDHIFTRGRPSKKKFAKACAINPSTFKHYAHGDVCKRTKIGTKLGRKKSTSMDRKVREGKLIKKARENIRLQEEADKSWDHRSMY